MPTVQNLIDSLPYHLQKRYGSAQIYRWVNQGLRRIASEGVTPTISKEVGVIVENDVWIEKPTGLIRAKEIFSPRHDGVNYPFEDIENKIKLVGRTFDEDEDPVSVTTFSSLAAASVAINVTDVEKDEYENALLIIDTGTWAGKTFRISGNDATSGSTTTIYFLHELSAAPTVLQIITGRIIDEYSYLMLKYDAEYEEVDSLSDEISLEDEFEDCLISFLNWKAHERVQVVSQDTKYWEGQFEKDVGKIKESRLRVNRKQAQIGRPLTGMRQNRNSRYTFRHTSD